MNKAAEGALVGLAVGDALGTTLEFKRVPPLAWDPPVLGPHTQVTGGGPFRVLPGQVTDDTMMAACLASSLKARSGFDDEDAARRYVEWAEVTFDIGGQTRAALSEVKRGAAPDAAGRAAWERMGRQAAGNGSLMRTAPIGVFYAENPLRIAWASVSDSSITHFDPRCVLACAALNAAIGYAVRNEEADIVPESKEILRVAREGLSLGVGLFVGQNPDLFEVAARAHQDLDVDLAFSACADPQLYSPELHLTGTQGFVRVAFRLAFWEMAHASSFREGLVDAVNRGGDADTNGAIVGALLGALHGADAIPLEWTRAVLECRPEAPFDAAGPLHPLRLLELLRS